MLHRMEWVIEARTQSQTKRVGRLLAREIVRSRDTGPLLIGLVGELGAGKTTFLQGFARGLGVRESVRSPTFILMKTYILAKLQTPNSKLRTLVHIDCYRLDQPHDLLKLGWRDILMDPGSLIVVEWADRVKKFLPRAVIWIQFEHGKRANERRITIPS